MSDSVKKYHEMQCNDGSLKQIILVPKHYKTDSIDVIDFCKGYNLNFNKGNIVKYICRAGKKEKESELKDLQKALVYLQREINYLNQN